VRGFGIPWAFQPREQEQMVYGKGVHQADSAKFTPTDMEKFIQTQHNLDSFPSIGDPIASNKTQLSEFTLHI
jgi:hypothetical protein